MKRHLWAENNPTPYHSSSCCGSCLRPLLFHTLPPSLSMLQPHWPPCCVSDSPAPSHPRALAHANYSAWNTPPQVFTWLWPSHCARGSSNVTSSEKWSHKRPLSHQLQQYLSCDSRWFFPFNIYHVTLVFSFHSIDDQYLNLSQDFFKSWFSVFPTFYFYLSITSTVPAT